MTATIIAAVLLLLALGYIWLQRRSKYLLNQQKDAFHNMDVFLFKRAELVPQLVVSVQGYADHEAKTLMDSVINRQKLKNPSDIISAEKSIDQQLHQISILKESHPDLKASDNFLRLQNQLVEIEDELERSRTYYNATVKHYNTFGESFPASLFQKPLGFKRSTYYQK